MMYPEYMLQPMREELTRLGVQELRTADAVDALPAELRVRCAAPRRFAEIACGIEGVEGVRIEDGLVVVATRRPAAVLEEAVPRAVDEGLGVSEVVPADRSLEGIFGRLVRLHRGVKA
jgi:hypothetical protein